jgi:hypothetical protein
MNYQHQRLAQGKWNELTLMEQLANVGSEVERAIKWKEKNNLEYCRMAFERALELMTLTIADKKNMPRLKEIARVREALVDYFAGDNDYASSDENWRKYFLAFNYAARLKK